MAESVCGSWAQNDPLAKLYHDKRWCVPVHDDRELFAMLCLEGQQAGLSWTTILRKEAAIRHAFDEFDIETVASYDEAKVESLMNNPQIIRNRAKIRSATQNANAILKMLGEDEFLSFDAYVWHFTEGKQIDHCLKTESDTPAENDLSKLVSKDMKKRGFRFVGPVIVYSFLQGVGVFNDHLMDCPCRNAR